jgi:predicted Zn-ribbon and HTH transcriptional regulator
VFCFLIGAQIFLGIYYSIKDAIIRAKLRKYRNRFGPGRCSGCGYDIRASPDQCPECGKATLTPKPPPKKLL